MYYLKIFYLNLTFYLLFLLFSVVSIPVLMLAVAFSAVFLPRRRILKLNRRLISFYGAVVSSLSFPLIKVSYDNCNKDNGPGPFIFVCNHRSAIDPFLIWCIPYELVQVVNTWPFNLPLLGVNAKIAEYININAMPFETFLQKSLSLLNDGVSIVFFPEGTRSANGEMNQFHSAAFRLSLQSKVPVVPICISGTGRVLPKGSWSLRPGKIRVRMLPAIHLEDMSNLNAYSYKNIARRTISSELKTMDQRNEH